jgi:hypothetical protein
VKKPAGHGKGAWLADALRPASHKFAGRDDFTKKGNPALVRISFRYCDGAEGGI